MDQSEDLDDYLYHLNKKQIYYTLIAGLFWHAVLAIVWGTIVSLFNISFLNVIVNIAFVLFTGALQVQLNKSIQILVSNKILSYFLGILMWGLMYLVFRTLYIYILNLIF